MKNFLVAFVLLSSVFLRADAASPQSSTRSGLWAAILPSRVVYEENGARVSLTFTLFNEGKTAVNVKMGETKLLVNGKAVDWGWENREYIHKRLQKGDVIKPGAMRNTQTDYDTRFYRYFRKPGIYKLRWVGKNFQSPEVSIRVRARQNGDFETSTMKLVRQIRGVLPLGWEVSLVETVSTPSSEWIEISRVERTKVAERYGISDNPINHVEESRHLSFAQMTFYIAPLLTPAQYGWRKEENAQIAQRLDALDEKEQLPRSKGQVSEDSRDDSKNAQVARYKWLQRLQQTLPDFYFEDVSLYQSGFSTSTEEVENLKVRREYEIVQAQILKFLKRYEPAK